MLRLAPPGRGLRAHDRGGCLLYTSLLACRRARLLPEGGDPDPLAHTGLGEALRDNLAISRHVGHVGFDDAARLQWYLSLIHI